MAKRGSKYLREYVKEEAPKNDPNTPQGAIEGFIDETGDDGQQQGGKNAKATAEASAKAAAAKPVVEKKPARNYNEIATDIAEDAEQLYEQANDWALRAPVVGGIGMILLALFFFVFAIVPVNDQGHTRAYLLWQTFMGNTKLKGGLTSDTAETAFQQPTSSTPGITQTPNSGTVTPAIPNATATQPIVPTDFFGSNNGLSFF